MAIRRQRVFQVGERLKELRLVRAWTLRDLAEQSGVSQGMLSKLESRSVNPSLSVIGKLAAAFGLTIGQFLGENDTATQHEMIMLKQEERTAVVNPETGYEREELSPAPHGRGVEFVRSTIPPHSPALIFPPHALNVEELLFVERGSLRVTLGDQVVTLRAGDSLFLKPSARHSYENPGEEPCVCFIIIDSHLAITAEGRERVGRALPSNSRPAGPRSRRASQSFRQRVLHRR